MLAGSTPKGGKTEYESIWKNMKK